MKKLFLLVYVLFAGSLALASTETEIIGEWNLGSRACTSNTPIQDGVQGINVTFNTDKSFELLRTVANCETKIKGTYAVEGMRIIFTSATSQSCTDTSPQPMPETYSMYAAYLGLMDMVLVATGSKAAACPAPDALILNYERNY